MANQLLVRYITELSAESERPEVIVDQLRAAGWGDRDIAEASAQAFRKKKPKKSSRLTELAFLLLCVCLFAGYQYVRHSSNIPNPNTAIASEAVASSVVIPNAQVDLQTTVCHQVSVLSALAGGEVSVEESGKVDALKVSNVGAQIVFVTDANGSTICLAALSVPGQSSLTFDAASTATAAIMLSPGILVSDPVEASTRLALIAQLKSYPAFLQYLQEHLVTTPYSSLTQQASYTTLLTACVTEMSQELAASNE